MKSKIILSPFVICLICLITNPNLFAQKSNLTPGSPEWLVDMFFNQNRFDEKADYYAGEMLNEVDQPTIGEELSGSAVVSSRVLVSNDDEFVFAVEVKVEEIAIEFYSYIIKTADGWKINAIRRFLLPKFVYSVVDSLSTLTNLSADDSSLFIPLKFLTMNDIQLKAFLTEHSDELYDLAWFFKHEEDANIEASLSSLGCSGIFMDEKYSGCVFIQASSFEMMEVGFINAGADSVLPEISPYDFVYIENVLPGWYVYRLM
jgi:hypothetical protein